MDKKSFKKYRLVAADEEDQDRRKFKDIKDYDPMIWNRVRTDNEIDYVLSNPSLAPDIKLRLINSLIILDKEKLKKNFEKAQEAGIQQINNPAAVQIQPQIPVQQPGIILQHPAIAGHAAPQGIAPINLQSVLQQPAQRDLVEVSLGFPVYLKSRTEKLLESLKMNYPGLITTNDKFELIVNNATIPNSNVVDILGFMVNPGKRRLAPNGYAAFLSALASVNIDPAIVPSKKIKTFLGKAARVKAPAKEADVDIDEFFDAPQTGQGNRKRKVIGYIFRKKRKNIKHVSTHTNKLKKRSYLKSLNLY